MRIVKNADVRKNEILDAALMLFSKKGYDGTSTNDILDEVGIARGTLYHHFRSKEDIMDALVNRQMEEIRLRAQGVALDKSIPVKERIGRVILSLKVSDDKEYGDSLIDHLHKPQNALMHQKINQIMMEQIPPILAIIIEEGNQQNVFSCMYPLECMEMAFVYLKTVFDDGLVRLSEDDAFGRIKAFLFHLEKLLGIEKGSLEGFLNFF